MVRLERQTDGRCVMSLPRVSFFRCRGYWSLALFLRPVRVFAMAEGDALYRERVVWGANLGCFGFRVERLTGRVTRPVEEAR